MSLVRLSCPNLLATSLNPDSISLYRSSLDSRTEVWYALSSRSFSFSSLKDWISRLVNLERVILRIASTCDSLNPNLSTNLFLDSALFFDDLINLTTSSMFAIASSIPSIILILASIFLISNSWILVLTSISWLRWACKASLQPKTLGVVPRSSITILIV